MRNVARRFLTIIQPPLAPVRACRRKFRSDRLISYEVFIVNIIVPSIGCGTASVHFSFGIELPTQALFSRVIDIADSALESRINWPVVGET